MISTGPAKPRVLVSTDIGGTDPDDFQSMVHLLVYADRLDIEGLVSSPYGSGRASDILRVIDCYQADYPNLRSHTPDYPAPDALRAVVRQGALQVADSRGFYDQPSAGSDWIIDCAHREDPRPLDVLIWGGIDDLAQALHDAPDIKPRIRVHYIGGPNKMWGVDAYNYLESHHRDLTIIESNTTYRGFFDDRSQDGSQDRRFTNSGFVEEQVAGHGALGEFFAAQLPRLKMGDSPTVSWLLHGVQDPTKPSWGGSFIPIWDGRKTTFDRLTTADDKVEVYGVVEFVLPKPQDFGPDDTARMKVDNRPHGPHAIAVDEGDRLRFRWSPRDAKEIPYVIESSHPGLDGQEGALTASPPRPPQWQTPSTRHPNWWCDDQAAEAEQGRMPGVKTITRWRRDFLTDFAERMNRCRRPAP